MLSTKQRILIIDDDEEIGRLYGVLLEDGGYSVSSTLSGKYGLEAIQEGGFDLVILDLAIPEVDGFEILSAIRTQATKPKILAISGALPDMLAAAKAYGADLVLDKLIARDFLIVSVRNLIGTPG